MIIDASALLSLIFREEDAMEIRDLLLDSPSVAVGTPTLTEVGIVLEARLGADSHGMLERLLDEFSIQEIPFGEIHWREAVAAFQRFGKGRHPARLNFGDCMTYAVARLAGEPLLYVGRDFARTDLPAARTA
ncbi:MAG: type II toxin-antitoxin system VapC family toxin [Gemmatimonadales bacterium]|nr:MAG: type II toxin-antitoxin system VapC family toxin [Gemmatimonadales bacterium]